MERTGGFLFFHGGQRFIWTVPSVVSCSPATSHLPAPPHPSLHQFQTSPMLSKALTWALVPHKAPFSFMSRAPWVDPSSLAHPHQQWGPAQGGLCQVKQPKSSSPAEALGWAEHKGKQPLLCLDTPASSSRLLPENTMGSWPLTKP